MNNEKMAQFNKEAAFRGITKYPCGEFFKKYKFAEYIQAYFLVIKKKCFTVMRFWIFGRMWIIR